MPKKVVVPSVLAAILLMTGCVREQYSRCNPGVNLSFEYILHDYSGDMFCSEVEKISVFVFDCDGYYLETYSESSDKLQEGYVMHLPLKGGTTYTFVAWGGTLSNHKIGSVGQTGEIVAGLEKGISRLDDFRLALRRNEGRNSGRPVVLNPNPLFYGIAKELIVTREKKVSKQISLIRNTSRINLTLTDLRDQSSAVRQQSPFDIYITADNSIKDAENRVPDDSPVVTFLPMDVQAEGNSYQIQFRAKQLIIGRDVDIVIDDIETGENIITQNLIDIILEHPAYNTQRDIDREDLFELGFIVERTPDGPVAKIKISVNGWEVEYIEPATSRL